MDSRKQQQRQQNANDNVKQPSIHLGSHSKVERLR
jgi:hypothetical protein